MHNAYSVTSQIIADAAQRLAGVELGKGGAWSWCALSLNATQAGCPSSAASNNTRLNMIVAVFNPGTHFVNHTKVPVPHGNFSVSVFNASSRQFQPANATVICDLEAANDTSCWLYTEYLLQGHEIGFMRVAFNESSDLLARRSLNSKKIQNSV